MKKAIIVDLDGTLCNCEHRRPFAQKGDWKSFFDLIGEDEVNEWCKAIIQRFFEPGKMEILLVSGRPVDHVKVTTSWLLWNQIPYTSLYMRAHNDNREDFIVKEEIFLNHIKPEFNIFFVIDDRKRVVEMWRKHGLTVLHCDEGNF